MPIRNPFPGAVSFLVRETGSTQDEARRLARLGFPPGSLVAAERQSAGRGRIEGRRWESAEGESLLVSLRLAPEAATLPALPLRVGAALCRAVGILAIRSGRDLSAPPRLKWPNDLLIRDRKAAGILCEAGPEGVFVGVGVNCGQRGFAPELEGRATSLALELGLGTGEIPDRWALLELYLSALKTELAESDWRPGVEELLWRRGEEVSFLPGISGLEEAVEGRLEGIDASGALLLREAGAAGSIAPRPAARAFYAGELRLPRRAS